MAATISNKTVVVTGGSRGIGLEFVSELLKQHNIVVATARHTAKAQGLQDLAQKYGDKLILLDLDIGSPESIAAWADKLKGKVSHIDVLINNAGVLNEPFDLGIQDVTPKIFHDTLSVNTFGPFFVAQALLEHGLLGGANPTLCVYISSRAASIGGYTFVEARCYAYRASKTALNMLVRTSVEELTTRNITSVLLHPGYVATDMNNHKGTVSVAESVTGQLKLLEDGRPLNGKFYSYTGEELAW